jgi:hypothetical protein
MLTQRRFPRQGKLPEKLRKVFSQGFYGFLFRTAPRGFTGRRAPVRRLARRVHWFGWSRSNSLPAAVEVEGAQDSFPRSFRAGTFDDVEVNHGGGDTGVPHQFLDGADVDALLEEVGGEAKRPRAGGLLDGAKRSPEGKDRRRAVRVNDEGCESMPPW